MSVSCLGSHVVCSSVPTTLEVMYVDVGTVSYLTGMVVDVMVCRSMCTVYPQFGTFHGCNISVFMGLTKVKNIYHFKHSTN